MGEPRVTAAEAERLALLIEECAELQHAIEMLAQAHDISRRYVAGHQQDKAETIHRWLHHQDTPTDQKGGG